MVRDGVVQKVNNQFRAGLPVHSSFSASQKYVEEYILTRTFVALRISYTELAGVMATRGVQMPPESVRRMKAFFVFLIPPPEYPSVAYRQVD
jgi:hypothetical protein